MESLLRNLSQKRIWPLDREKILQHFGKFDNTVTSQNTVLVKPGLYNFCPYAGDTSIALMINKILPSLRNEQRNNSQLQTLNILACIVISPHKALPHL